MKHKLCLFAILIILASTSSADDHLVRTMNVSEVHYEFVKRIDRPNVTMILRVKDGATIWSRVWDTSKTGSDIVDYSNLIAIRKEGDVIAALISLHPESDYRWIRAEFKNGSWKTAYEQKLVGIASQKLRTKHIELPSLDMVRVTNESGEAISFTRTDQGSILRSGLPYANKPEGSLIITKP